MSRNDVISAKRLLSRRVGDKGPTQRAENTEMAVSPAQTPQNATILPFIPPPHPCGCPLAPGCLFFSFFFHPILETYRLAYRDLAQLPRPSNGKLAPSHQASRRK